MKLFMTHTEWTRLSDTAIGSSPHFPSVSQIETQDRPPNIHRNVQRIPETRERNDHAAGHGGGIHPGASVQNEHNNDYNKIEQCKISQLVFHFSLSPSEFLICFLRECREFFSMNYKAIIII